jgi:hypothetical protein
VFGPTPTAGSIAASGADMAPAPGGSAIGRIGLVAPWVPPATWLERDGRIARTAGDFPILEDVPGTSPGELWLASPTAFLSNSALAVRGVFRADGSDCATGVPADFKDRFARYN